MRYDSCVFQHILCNVIYFKSKEIINLLLSIRDYIISRWKGGYSYLMNACKLLRKSIFYGLLCTIFVGTSFSRPLSVQAETITAYTSDTPNGLPEDAFSDYWKMATKTYTYTPQVDDYTTVQGDSSSLTSPNQIKPYESFVENPTTALFQKVSDFTVLDSQEYDSSLFSDYTLKYTTDEDAVTNYINMHPELSTVTDHRILLPVFEFDTDNDLATFQNHFDTDLANGLIPAGAVGRDNQAVIDPIQPLGQYSLEKTLTYDTVHGFYYIYQLHVGIADVDRQITTLVDSNGNETELNGLYTAPAVLGNDILDHKKVFHYFIPEGKEGDGNLVRPAIHITRTYYYYKLAHTAYVSDDGTTLQPIDEGLQPAPATISSYTYDHTDETAAVPTLDVDKVTQRLLSQLKAQDVTQIFSRANATQVGDIVIEKDANNIPSVFVLEPSGLSYNISYDENGNLRVHDHDGNPVYYDNTYQDVLYTTATDDSLAVGEYRVTYSLSPLIHDLYRMDSVQHLFVNLVVGTRDDSRMENPVDRTHVYTRVPNPTTPTSPNTLERTPNTADYNHTSRDAFVLGISLFLTVCISLFRNHIENSLR